MIWVISRWPVEAEDGVGDAVAGVEDGGVQGEDGLDGDAPTTSTASVSRFFSRKPSKLLLVAAPGVVPDGGFPLERVDNDVAKVLRVAFLWEQAAEALSFVHFAGDRRDVNLS